MPPSSGFGRSRFGAGPFGEADWAHNMFWLGVPSVYRDNDSQGLFETLLRSYGYSFDQIRHRARGLPDVRDPIQVRTRYNETVSVTFTDSEVTEAEDSADGKPYITFAVSVGTLPNLETVGPGWVMEATERNYFVRTVSKVDGVFTVYGDDIPADTTQIIRPPSMIEYLGRDFGVEVDGHEPEGFQRGLVSRAVQWYDLKGTAKGIRLRAELAGFSATIKSLWALGPGWEVIIPSANLFEMESGRFYTDICPCFPQFDDIPADVIPLDTVCEITPVTFPITVSSVTVVGDLFRLAVSSPADLSDYIANENGPWKITSGANEFYVELIDLTLNRLWIAGSTAPTAGAYTLEYDCQPVDMCSWCKSYKIVLELVPTNAELLASPIALDGAFDRLIRKIEAILPAHVEVVYTLVTTGGATIEVTGGGSSSTYVFGSFDDIAADVQTVDTPTLIITA